MGSHLPVFPLNPLPTKITMPVFRLPEEPVFPRPHLATREGLLAVGGDLSPKRLLAAYRQGIFPWYSDGEPILWWSPNPRMVLYPNEFKQSKSFKKTLRKGVYRISSDTTFEKVIEACAATRLQSGEGTWITAEMMSAYIEMHNLGYAHSVEAWHEGQLVGGLYGLALGLIFFGESMFSTMNDASKVCLYHLTQFLVKNRFIIIDCQVSSPHLMRLGARNISREDFLTELNEALKYRTLKGNWRI